MLHQKQEISHEINGHALSSELERGGDLESTTRARMAHIMAIDEHLVTSQRTAGCAIEQAAAKYYMEASAWGTQAILLAEAWCAYLWLWFESVKQHCFGSRSRLSRKHLFLSP